MIIVLFVQADDVAFMYSRKDSLGNSTGIDDNLFEQNSNLLFGRAD